MAAASEVSLALTTKTTAGEHGLNNVLIVLMLVFCVDVYVGRWMGPGAKPKEHVTGIVSRGTSLKGTLGFSPNQHIQEISIHGERRSVGSYTLAPDELHERRARTIQEEPLALSVHENDVSITDIKNVMCPRCRGNMQLERAYKGCILWVATPSPLSVGTRRPVPWKVIHKKGQWKTK